MDSVSGIGSSMAPMSPRVWSPRYGAGIGETEKGEAAGFVRSAVRDSVGWIELDRPPVNAFEWVMVGQVADALDAFEVDSRVRVLVLASAVKRYFSAGADL